MAEAIGVVASVITIIQSIDQIIKACKSYIGAVQDHPTDLRVILLEASTLKTVFENLNFLIASNSGVSSIVATLSGQDGPIEGCRQSITELEKLLPTEYISTTVQSQSKRRKVTAIVAGLAWPLKENKARKLLETIVCYKTTICLVLTTASIQDLRDINGQVSKINDILTDSQRQEVYKWLQHTDPSSLHHRAQKQYESGTGNWILRSPDWADWLDAKQRCLWVHGIPGAGKTVLMSYLIEQVKQRCEQSQSGRTAYVYYYCYFGHNQDEAVPFLRWLLNQLCRQADVVPNNVYKMYKYGGEPSLADLLMALENVVDRFEVTYLIVDAIDESNPREDLLKIFRDIITDPRFKKLQLLASSREYIDIEEVMEELSVSVSMANPFVEEDIRLCVRSTMQSDPKFEHWPQTLLDEAENAVSTGARGMFRWAVCQIDTLRRLKCERDIVKKALANLPKTLYETYDRIFLTVPKEEQLFVHHTLLWIDYNNELCSDEGIPCTILLQGVAESMARLAAYQTERFYDEGTLRELCGCLISVKQEDATQIEIQPTALKVSFAHYTVREYLDSTRISSYSTVDMTTCKQDFKLVFMEIIFMNAQHWEFRYETTNYELLFHHIVDSCQTVSVKFSLYCALSALRSLRNWASEITQYDTLCTLVLDFWNPSTRAVATMDNKAMQTSLPEQLDLQPLYADLAGFVTYRSVFDLDPSDTDAAYLLKLLFLAYENSTYLVLSKRFLEEKYSKDIFECRLSFTAWGLTIGPLSFEDCEFFEDTILEVFARLAYNRVDEFKLLLEYGTGLFDPSQILLLYTGNHYHDIHCDGHEYCLIERLLEYEADPNMKGYLVTPLQIAVGSWDFQAVHTLLRAGANSNGTGDCNGIIWKEDTYMNRFNLLHSASPLQIRRSNRYIHGAGLEEHERRKNYLEIEEILLQYGAAEFKKPCECKCG